MGISAAGFLLCLIFHIAVWLNGEMQWYIVTQVLLLGMVLLNLPAFVIKYRLRRIYGSKKGHLQALKSVFPGWIAALMGFLIMYAMVVAVLQVHRKGKPAIAYSALLMAGYAVTTACYYSYNRLRSSDNGNPPLGDNISRSPAQQEITAWQATPSHFSAHLGGLSLVLMLISRAGFLACIIVHIAAWLDVEMALSKVMLILLAGMILVYISVGLIGDQLRRTYGNKALRKAMKRTSPEWMEVMLGFILMYAIIVACIQIVRKGERAIMFTALLTAGYSTAFGMVYSYKHLKINDNGNSLEDDNTSYTPES